MAILKTNSGSGATLECSIPNKSSISARIQQTGININLIRAEIARYRTKVQSSSDPVIQAFTIASSFPIEDLNQLLTNNPDASYLRIYHALTDTDEHICYLAAVDEDFQSFTNDDTVISKTCCQCKPCMTNDALLT